MMFAPEIHGAFRHVQAPGIRKLVSAEVASEGSTTAPARLLSFL